jgi:hypothetical protein
MVDFTQPQERSDDTSQYDQSQFPENSDWDRIDPGQDRPRQPYYEYQGAKRRPSQDWGTPNQANQFAENYGPAMPQGPYWPTMQQMPHLMKSTMADISTFSLPMQRGAIGAMQGSLAYMKAYKAAYDKERDAAPKRELEQMSIALKKLAIETDAQNREYHDILAGTDPGSEKQQQQLYTAAVKHRDQYLISLIEEGEFHKATDVLAERDKYSQDWQNMQKAADAHLKELDERGAAADRHEEHQWKKEDRGKGGGADLAPEIPPLEKIPTPKFDQKPEQEQQKPEQEQQKPEQEQQKPEQEPKPEAPTTPDPSQGPAPLQGRQPSPLRRPTERPAAPAAEQQGELEQPQEGGEQQQDQGGEQPTRLAQADTGTASDAPQPGAQRVAQAAPPPAPGQAGQAPAPGTKQTPGQPQQPKTLDDYAEDLGKWAGVSAEQVKQDAFANASGRNVYHPVGDKLQRQQADKRNQAAHNYLSFQESKLQSIRNSMKEYRDARKDKDGTSTMTPEEEKKLREWGLKQINEVDWRLAEILPPILRGDNQFKSYAYASLSPRVQLTKGILEALDPFWSERRYEQKTKATINFFGSNGMWNTRMAAAATSIQHSAVFAEKVAKLNNSDLQTLNTVKNWFDKETGSSNIVELRASILAWAQELQKSFRANGGSLHEVQEILNNVSTSSSKEQFMGYIRTMDGLLMGQVNTGTAVWNRSTYDNKTPEQFLRMYTNNDQALRWLKIIQGEESGTEEYRKGHNRYVDDTSHLSDPVEQIVDSPNAQAYQWYIKHKYWDKDRFGPDPDADRLEPIRRKLLEEGYSVK